LIKKEPSQPTRLGEIDAETIPSALVFAGHLGRGMAEMLPHIAFVYLCGGRKTGTQRVAGKEPRALAFGKIAAYPG
jgi:hypothetical protein